MIMLSPCPRVATYARKKKSVLESISTTERIHRRDKQSCMLQCLLASTELLAFRIRDLHDKLFCRAHATSWPCGTGGGVAEESGSVTLSHSYDEDVSDGGPVPPGLDLPLLVAVVSDFSLLRRVDSLEEVAEAESLAAEDFGVADGRGV